MASRSVAALLALLAPAPAVAARAALAVGTTSGSSPLATTFDTSASTLDAGQTPLMHLVLPGNGDAVPITTTSPTPLGYTYALPGFYLAGSWLAESPSGGFALATPVGVSVARTSDGQSPAAVDVGVASTSDPLTVAFTADVTAAASDPEVARRWDFGDGSTSGASDPQHAYANAGVYQAALLSTSRSGMTAEARVLVAIAAPDGSLPPSLLVGMTPPDGLPLTPVQLVAYVDAATAPTVVSAHVDWPGLVDAAPAVTTESTGVVVRSSYVFPAPGRYDVPVTVTVVGQTLTATGHVTVGQPSVNGGVDAPSPSLVAAPATSATVGQAYEPNGAGASLRGLLVGGDGPL
ncbi:MAG TPA: PKD domain-containing protein, partial [Polyangia bacterium]|nr:PKD domain-containing protein [Polyangia bacterium]